MIQQRPWGTYEILNTDTQCQIKRIVVNPGQQTSLQSHAKRSEHWIVLEGVATVTLGSQEHSLNKNATIFIPVGEKHRLSNKGTTPLTIIEVQTGSYFGEDDIVRYADDYGR